MRKENWKKECTVKLTCLYKTPIPCLKTSVFKKKKKKNLSLFLEHKSLLKYF